MTAARTGLPAAHSISSLSSGGRERPRVETATLLARLERQRTMLEKQLQVWRKQKQKTEQRLAAVEKQIEALCESLSLARAPSSALGARPETPAPSRQRIDLNYGY